MYLFSGNALGFVGFFFPEIGDVRGEIETERRVYADLDENQNLVSVELREIASLILELPII